VHRTFAGKVFPSILAAMMRLAELDRWFSELLDIRAVEGVDPGRNGLQVSRRAQEVSKVAFAVDACSESFRRAAEQGADLLFVHHGLLWGESLCLTGTFYERVRFLVEHDLALYAAHLPLDMHPEVGNNAGIARRLGLVDIAPFGSWKGLRIGLKGRLPSPVPLDQVAAALAGPEAAPIRTLPFGPAEVRTAGVISGGAPWEALQAIEEGLDCYVTGEAAHGIYHHCLEAGISVMFAGHYHSETFGVRLLAERLAADTGLETTYLDIPTGL
jgi:dinuclear metal center YbgI/SA1388 family protein